MKRGLEKYNTGDIRLIDEDMTLLAPSFFINKPVFGTGEVIIKLHGLPDFEFILEDQDFISLYEENIIEREAENRSRAKKFRGQRIFLSKPTYERFKKQLKTDENIKFIYDIITSSSDNDDVQA